MSKEIVYLGVMPWHISFLKGTLDLIQRWTARVYPGGARRRQRMAGRRPTGQGGRGRRSGPPTPPPPRPCPSLRATGATLRPPRAEETPPLPQKGPRRGRGGDAAGPAHRAPQRPQPPAPGGVAADGRAHTSAPERRADQAWGRHTAAHQNSMGAAPPMTPPKTIAHSGRAEGGFRSEEPPRERSTGRPSSPPPPGRPRDPDQTRPPGGSAPTTRGGPG